MDKFSDNHPDQPESRSAVKNPARRDFLGSAGMAVAGGLAVAAGAGLLAGGAKADAAQAAPPPLPWKYTQLDPLEAGKRGYKFYLEKGG